MLIHPHAESAPERQSRRFATDFVLECARGIAALWVFMFHIAPMLAPWPVLETIARHGHQGVPLFFVISGYCMYAAAENTLRAKRAPSSFLKRRLWRIFPPFWVSVLVVMLAPFALEGVSSLKSGVFVPPEPRWAEFTWRDWISLLTLTKVFNNPGGDLQVGFSPINAVYWSLAIEVQFYLVMYASLFFRSSWKKVLAWITGLSVLATFSPVLNNSGLFMKFWPAFALGALLRFAHQRGWTPAAAFGRREIAVSMLGAGVLGAVVVGIMFAPSCATPLACSSVPNLAFTVASAAAALAVWLMAGVEHGLMRSKWIGKERFTWLLLPFVWLGQSSYSLYLLHGKIYQLPEMMVRQLITPTSIAYPVLTITGTAALCYAFYRVAEKPFHTYAKAVDASSITPEVPATGVRS